MRKKAKILQQEKKKQRKKRKQIKSEKRLVRKNLEEFEKLIELESQQKGIKQKPVIAQRRALRQKYLKALKIGDIKEAEYISNQTLKFEIYRKLEKDEQEEILI